MRWTEKTVHVEKKVAHGNHGLLRSLMTSVDILTSLYSALFTALEKKSGLYMVNNGFMNKSRLLAPEDV